MRRVVFHGQSEKDHFRWAALPALCCQAAGGEPEKTEPISAAWLSFYMAAGIMDSIEDGDTPDDWWREAGSGLALSVATGLYFSGNLALNNLEETLGSAYAARQIRQEMLRKFLEMGAGQHLDIITPCPGMEQYWQIAHAKSGAFFSMACWAGARVATRKPKILQGYQQFGVNVGLLIQVLDDLHDYLLLNQSKSPSPVLDLKRSLPAVYIREVAPDSVRNQFESLIIAENKPEVTDQIVEIIENYGGARYIYSELDRLYQSAVGSLEQAEASQPAREQLMDLLNELRID